MGLKMLQLSFLKKTRQLSLEHITAKIFDFPLIYHAFIYMTACFLEFLLLPFYINFLLYCITAILRV